MKIHSSAPYLQNSLHKLQNKPYWPPGRESSDTWNQKRAPISSFGNKQDRVTRILPKAMHCEFIGEQAYLSTPLIGIPVTNPPQAGQLLQDIRNYYDEIDRNDVPAALARFTPDAVYIRNGAKNLEGDKKVLSGMGEIAAFYANVRSLQGEHLIATSQSPDEIRAAFPLLDEALPKMWSASSLETLGAHQETQAFYKALIEDEAILNRFKDRINMIIVVRGAHHGQPNKNGSRIIEFDDIWCFQEDRKACLRKSILQEPFIRPEQPEEPPKNEGPPEIFKILEELGFRFERLI
jgi:hypothetical protein